MPCGCLPNCFHVFGWFVLSLKMCDYEYKMKQVRILWPWVESYSFTYLDEESARVLSTPGMYAACSWDKGSARLLSVPGICIPLYSSNLGSPDIFGSFSSYLTLEKYITVMAWAIKWHCNLLSMTRRKKCFRQMRIPAYGCIFFFSTYCHFSSLLTRQLLHSWSAYFLPIFIAVLYI